MKFLLRTIIPAEWLALFGLFVFGGFVVLGYPLLIPRTHGGEILFLLGRTKNYGVILLSSIALFVLVTLLRGLLRQQFKTREMLAETVIFLRLLLSLLVAVYLMLCFKWWSHLHGTLYDEQYIAADHALGWLKGGMFALADWLAIPHIYYFEIFSYVFLFGYMLCIAFNTRLFVRMVTTGVAVALLGGMAYMLAPAYGPMAFALPDDQVMKETQNVMLKVSRAFRESGGKAYDPLMFEAVLGAMPSLHVAHSLAITIYIWRLHLMAGLVFAVVTLYIAMYAVITHFHYIVDLPVGVLLALCCVVLVDRLYRDFDSRQPSQSTSPSARKG